MHHLNKMRRVPLSDRDTIDTPSTHIYDRSCFPVWHGRGHGYLKEK